MYAGERVEFLALQGLHLVPYGTELLPSCARATSAVSVVVTNYRLLLQFLGLTRDKKTRPPITLPLMSIANVQRGSTSSEAQALRNDTLASKGGLFGYSITQQPSQHQNQQHASDFNTNFSHNPTLASGSIDPKALTGDPLLWVDVMSKQGSTYRLATRAADTQIQFVASLFDSELAAHAKQHTGSSSSSSKLSSANAIVLGPLKDLMHTLTTDLLTSSSSDDDEEIDVKTSPQSPLSASAIENRTLAAVAAHVPSYVDAQPTATVSDVVEASVFMSELVKAMDRAMPRKLTDYFAFVHYAALRSGAVSAVLEQEQQEKHESLADNGAEQQQQIVERQNTKSTTDTALTNSSERLRALERQLINAYATNPSEWQPPGMKGSVRLSIVGSLGIMSAADALLLGLGKTLPRNHIRQQSANKHTTCIESSTTHLNSSLPSPLQFAKDLAKCHDTAWGAFNLLRSLYRMTVADTPTALDSVGLSTNLLPWFHVFELVGGRSLGAAIETASSMPSEVEGNKQKVATDAELRLYGDVVHDAELTRRSCGPLSEVINFNPSQIVQQASPSSQHSGTPTTSPLPQDPQSPSLAPVLCPYLSKTPKPVRGGTAAQIVSHPQMAVANANELRATFSTYPAAVILPKRASNIDTITACAKYRQNGRIPSVSWIHIDTGASLARSSQPRVGGGRNSRDDQLVLSYLNQALHADDAEAQHARDKERKAVAAAAAASALSPVRTTGRQAPPPSLMGNSASAPPPQLFVSPDNTSQGSNNFSATSVSITNTNPAAEDRMLHILDCRSVAAATTNMAAGGGYELVQNYQRAKIHFLNLDNIHGVRKAFERLTKLVQQSQSGDTIAMPRSLRQRIAASTGNTSILESSSSNNDSTSSGGAFWARLEATEWPLLVQRLLWSATQCTGYLQKGDSVLVHCTDGWDRTSQVVTLSMIMLDAHYRTIEGFCELLQREWLEYGHRFADRCGHYRKGGGEESVAAAASGATSPKHSASSDGIGTVLLSETATLINKYVLMSAAERKEKRQERRMEKKKSESVNNGDQAAQGPRQVTTEGSILISTDESPLHSESATSQKQSARRAKKHFSTGSQQPPPLIRSITDGRFQTKGSSTSVGVRPSGKEHDQSSPVFIQFLDAVYQLLRMFPDQFEFTSNFLIYIAEQVYGCRFGTFLMNCHRDRVQEQKVHAKAYHKAQHTFHSTKQHLILQKAQERDSQSQMNSSGRRRSEQQQGGTTDDAFDLINSYSSFDSKGHLLSGSANNQNPSALPTLEDVPGCCLRDGQYAAIATTTASVWGEIEELVLRERLYPQLTADSDKLINPLYDPKRFLSADGAASSHTDEENSGGISTSSLPTINGKPCAVHTAVPLIPSVQPRHYYFWNCFYARPHSHFTDFWHAIATVDAGYGGMGYTNFQSVGTVALNPFSVGGGTYGSSGGDPTNVAALISMFVQANGLTQVFKSSGEKWLDAMRRYIASAEEDDDGIVYGESNNRTVSSTKIRDSGVLERSVMSSSTVLTAKGEGVRLTKPLPHLVGFLFHMFRHRAHVLQMLLPTAAVAGVHPDSTLALAAKRVQQETQRKAEQLERQKKEAASAPISSPIAIASANNNNNSSLTSARKLSSNLHGVPGSSTTTAGGSSVTATNFARSIIQAMRGGGTSTNPNTTTAAEVPPSSSVQRMGAGTEIPRARRRSKSSDPQLLGSPNGSPGNSGRFLRGTPTSGGVASPHTTGGQPKPAFPSFASSASSGAPPMPASRRNQNGLDTPPAKLVTVLPNGALPLATRLPKKSDDSITSPDASEEQLRSPEKLDEANSPTDSQPHTPSVFRRRNAGLRSLASGPSTPNHNTHATETQTQVGTASGSRRSYSASAAADAIRNPHLFGGISYGLEGAGASEITNGHVTTTLSGIGYDGEPSHQPSHGEAVTFGSMEPEDHNDRPAHPIINALLFPSSSKGCGQPQSARRDMTHSRGTSLSGSNSSLSDSSPSTPNTTTSGMQMNAEVVDTEAAEPATPKRPHHFSRKHQNEGDFSYDDEDGNEDLRAGAARAKRTQGGNQGRGAAKGTMNNRNGVGEGYSLRTQQGTETTTHRPRSGSWVTGNRNGGQTRADFIPRSNANNCELCLAPFTFFFRRHCCRRCSRATCEKCSNHSVSLHPTEISLFEDKGSRAPLRVCTSCFADLQRNRGRAPPPANRVGGPSGNVSPAAELSTSDVPDYGDD